MINELRKKIAGEEFDYQVLMDSLREYERPRDRITDLLKKRKEIIRVKKGIYVFGEKYARRPVSREVLANRIYGPSYISLYYALHYYGLIQERKEMMSYLKDSLRIDPEDLRNMNFDKAAFYGGTALRILYGLDRFSEDLDFSLHRTAEGFDFSRFTGALEKEIRSFGFEVSLTVRGKNKNTQIQSAFLKADTTKQFLVIQAADRIVKQIPRGQVIKIKLEIDTDPPPGFETDNKYLLQPIPFPVRIFFFPTSLPGKCMPSCAGNGRAGSKAATGTTWSGIPIILSSI